MVTMKHNHNHKNYPHKKDHDHLWYPPWPWSLSQPPGQEEGAEEEPLPWRSSRWCSGARRSPSPTCSGSLQGLKKELLMMWLSCWSSASSAWIRKVKTCYFKPISGNNNNALMFAICVGGGGWVGLTVFDWNEVWIGSVLPFPEICLFPAAHRSTSARS